MVLAPIHRLPTEILATIFSAGRGQRCEHGGTFEVLVSQVSKRWRQVALNTVTLWSTISVQGHQRNKWILHYLERSKSAALDIRLDFWQLDSRWMSSEEHVLFIMSLFTPHAARIRNLNIKTYREETLTWILVQFQGLDASNLQRLSATTEEEVGDCDDVPTLTADKIVRGYAPRLQALHIDAAHASWIPLSGVRQMHLYGAWGGSLKLTLDQFVNIITAPLELTTLIVEGHLIDASSWPLLEPLPVIHLPHLRSLRVASSVSFIYEVLSRLSCPALESAWFDLTPSNTIHHFASLTGVSFPTVRHLAFHTTASCEQLDCTRLTGLSRVFPGVTFLSVSCFGRFCPALEHLEAVDRMSDLTVLPNTPHLFPDLKAIAVRGSPVGKNGRQKYDLASWKSVLADRIWDAAWARKQLGHPLKNVQVEGGWLTPSLKTKLSKLVAVEEVESLGYVGPLLASLPVGR